MTYEYLQFTVPGQPKGKGRARAVRSKRQIRMYTPESTKEYERGIQIMAVQALKSDTLCAAPIELSVTAYFSVPKSFTRKTRQKALEGRIRPTTKPDFDNVLKVVSDALNKIAWRDDAQVVSSTFRKFYSDTPRIEVYVRPQPEEA